MSNNSASTNNKKPTRSFKIAINKIDINLSANRKFVETGLKKRFIGSLVTKANNGLLTVEFVLTISADQEEEVLALLDQRNIGWYRHNSCVDGLSLITDTPTERITFTTTKHGEERIAEREVGTTTIKTILKYCPKSDGKKEDTSQFNIHPRDEFLSLFNENPIIEIITEIEPSPTIEVVTEIPLDSQNK